jgi:glycosyltransferase involved in cell wall biosynthesis
VNEGYSTDGTYEAIKDIDSKIKIHRNHWDDSDPRTWHIKFKNDARKLCNGDWCLLLDSDEFVPEWEFEKIRAFIAGTAEKIASLSFINFYGNYQVFHNQPEVLNWPAKKAVLHRNLPNIAVWGDGSNVGYIDKNGAIAEAVATCHHFGFVRHAARLRQKWRIQHFMHGYGPKNKARWDWVPGFVFDLLPHRWEDPAILPYLMRYSGPYIRAVTENPGEFVRDGFKTLELIDKSQR